MYSNSISVGTTRSVTTITCAVRGFAIQMPAKAASDPDSRVEALVVNKLSL